MKILKDEKTLITFSHEHIKRREKMPLHIKKKTFLYMKKKNICLYENIIRREKEEKRIAS